MRGVQLAPVATSQEEVVENINKLFYGEEDQHEKFIVARDFQNKQITEISFETGMLVAIAFFRPEVLSKYKADREKYDFEENHISCRGSWFS